MVGVILNAVVLSRSVATTFVSSDQIVGTATAPQMTIVRSVKAVATTNVGIPSTVKGFPALRILIVALWILAVKEHARWAVPFKLP